LDQVEQARDNRRILEALHLLEKSWTQLDQIPVSRSCRALKLLDIRAFELKTDVHEVFDHVWNTLVHVDIAKGSISITSSTEDEQMNLTDAVIGLKAYKEVDKRMKELWHDIDQAIISPRMDITKSSLPAIQVQDNLLQTAGTTDKTIGSLFRDLEQIFKFLRQKLPTDLVESISTVMMPEVITKVTGVWLDLAVPSSLNQMDEFQEVITVAKEFCRSLESLDLTGLGELQEWVDSAPRVWLGKCREAALDSVRSRLAEGLGTPKQVEKVEKQMVSRTEGNELTVSAAITDVEDHGWGDAWSDEEPEAETEPSKAPGQTATGEDDGTDAWGWNGDDTATEETPQESKSEEKDDEEDPADAWGWGDDDQAGHKEEVAPSNSALPSKQPAAQGQATRELTLKETYYMSSMPEPVLALIFALVEDGAALTQEGYENSPVAAAAAGLFSLPTLALAMFRAVSPHYYASDMGGNM
jgi:centromere/kinetochore protein ZW10